MDNQENKEQTRDGVASNNFAARPGHCFNYHVNDNNGANSNQVLMATHLGLSRNTVGTSHSYDPAQRNSSDVNNDSIQVNGSAYGATGSANMYRRRKPLSSSPYNISNATLPMDHGVVIGLTVESCKRAGGCKSKGTVHGSSSWQALPASDELEIIENIADILSPAEVRHLLFQGHENEHFSHQFLNPNTGSNVPHQGIQNVDVGRQSVSHPPDQVIDLRTSCIYCYQNIIYDLTTVSKRSCGHYFHMNCFHRQSEPVKGQHIRNNDCQFCLLEKQ